MKPPTAEKTWEEPHRVPLSIPWGKVWRIKSFYASPRDQLTWLKVHHRNLYLAGTSRDGDTSCRVCPERERIIHLVECRTIVAKFWQPLAQVMRDMGMSVPVGHLDRKAFWLLGRLNARKVVDPNQAGMMFIAWRCLYAEIVHSRVDQVPMRVERAYNRMWQMVITRLKAEGEKWNLWHRRNRHSGKKSWFPKKYQQKIVMKFTDTAEYTINPRILREYESTRRLDT